MANEDELAAIRRRRMEELQRQQGGGNASDAESQAEQQARQQQEEAMRESLMRQLLTPEARERLGRLKLARADEAAQLENQLIALAQSGRVQGKIDDEQLKLILGRLQSGARDINIRRK